MVIFSYCFLGGYSSTLEILGHASATILGEQNYSGQLGVYSSENVVHVCAPPDSLFTSPFQLRKTPFLKTPISQVFSNIQFLNPKIWLNFCSKSLKLNKKKKKIRSLRPQIRWQIVLSLSSYFWPFGHSYQNDS